MSPKLEKLLLLSIDFIALNIAFFTWGWVRREMGFFAESDFLTLLQISTVFNLTWLLLFAFFGLYSYWYAKSRVDEFISIFKTVSIGVLILFLLTLESEGDLSSPPKLSRMFIVNYWMILLFCLTVCRMAFRSIQRGLLAAGIGHRRTLIVGWGKKSWNLADDINRFPALGYNIIGFVAETKLS